MTEYDQGEHRRVLDRVLRAEPTLAEDIKLFDRFPFDVPEPLVVLTLDITREVLARHARGVISDGDLQMWADFLEVRPDVEVEPACHDMLTECLFELSEPLMAGKPMDLLAAEWLERLA